MEKRMTLRQVEKKVMEIVTYYNVTLVVKSNLRISAFLVTCPETEKTLHIDYFRKHKTLSFYVFDNDTNIIDHRTAELSFECMCELGAEHLC